MCKVYVPVGVSVLKEEITAQDELGLRKCVSF